MSLQYGFNSHGWDKDAAKWQAKFDALGENDKDFYHNHLGWMLVLTDVGHVSKETIPVIVFRVEKVSQELVPKLNGRYLTLYEFAEYLERFIGFEANVNTVTDREWAKRFMPRDWDKKASLKSDGQVDTERKRFDKEVFGVVR